MPLQQNGEEETFNLRLTKMHAGTRSSDKKKIKAPGLEKTNIQVRFIDFKAKHE